jgi:Fe-S protein assembly chaperone HscA
MDRIFGIDLGTTNSLIAYMDGDTPRVIHDPETGSALLPSVVAYLDAERTVVGAAARAGAARAPLTSIASVKRFMGLGPEHVTDADRAHYAFAADAKPDIVRFRVHGRDLTAPEVSAQVLRALKQRGERALGEEVRRVVITVPAYFNDSQRQATRDAGRLAGLEVIRLLNEPTAASLAYGLNQREQGMIAVYDFGGGTFDLSLLRIHDGIFEVVATSGDTRLGGDDMDRCVAAWLLERMPAALRADPEVNRVTLDAAERAKIALTNAAEAQIRVHVPARDLDLQATLSRTQLEELIAPIVERTLAPCRQALRDAHIDARAIDEVVLVGGSTRVPLVRQRVQELFGRTPHTEIDPDEAVALGAAVQAGVLAGRRTDMLLLDVVPLSLGIETVGGVMERLIERNTTIPVIARQTYTTFVDNQTAVDFHVVQGERELVKDNRSLARFVLRGIAPQPAGIPRVEVTFMVDANGILNVAARDARSGREQSVDVKPSYGLTDAEVERMLEESFDHAEDDVTARLLIEARNDADSILRATRNVLEHATDDERSAIGAIIATLEAALSGADHNRIRDVVGELNQATTPLAQRLMDDSIREALSHKHVTDLK